MEPRETVDRPAWYWWLSIPFGLGLLAVLALDAGAHAWWSAHVTRLTPRPLLLAILAAALLEHVRKALVAVRLAERAGLHGSSLAWGWQTFALGFPSLSLLRRRVGEPGAGTIDTGSARRIA